MTEIATRLQVGIAASAIAVAASLIPAAAQAAPSISSMPTAPVTQVLNNLSQYNWFYFGTPPNPAGPASDPIILWDTNVPVLIPVSFWSQLGLNNVEACFAGFGVKINAYGRVSGSFNIGGC
jgi:hypothetical protein